jgi:transposase-like protein
LVARGRLDAPAVLGRVKGLRPRFARRVLRQHAPLTRPARGQTIGSIVRRGREFRHFHVGLGHMKWTDTGRWARDEFGSVELGDARRKARLLAIATTAALRPHGRVSQVFTEPAARQGAYDFLESEHVPAQAIGAAMAEACAIRASAEPYVYVPIDGTSLSLADRANAKDFGSVGSFERGARGLKVIDAIAIDPRGVPLGVAGMRWWARQRPTRRDKRWRRRTEDKETQQWLESIAETQQLFEMKAPGTRAWFQIDREGDSQHILEKLAQSGHWFTVRSNSDRRIYLKGSLRPQPYREDWKNRHYLRRYLAHKIPLGFTHLEVPARAGGPARTARMAIRAAPVKLLLHDKRTSRHRIIKLNAVWTREHGRGPMRSSRSRLRKGRALDWLLLTNHPVSSLEEAARIVFGYAQRWRIEDFHKAWKSGVCNVEASQLQARAHVVKWATVLAAVALRAERLKHLSRVHPERPANEELSQRELEALILLKRRYRKRTEVIDDAVPTIETATRWIAELGGYTGKSSGGPPGTTTIARGLQRIQIATEILEELAASKKKR